MFQMFRHFCPDAFISLQISFITTGYIVELLYFLHYPGGIQETLVLEKIPRSGHNAFKAASHSSERKNKLNLTQVCHFADSLKRCPSLRGWKHGSIEMQTRQGSTMALISRLSSGRTVLKMAVKILTN